MPPPVLNRLSFGHHISPPLLHIKPHFFPMPDPCVEDLNSVEAVEFRIIRFSNSAFYIMEYA